ncbi:hypothetical protein EJB05_18776, partial [Eragrostis curvula]
MASNSMGLEEEPIMPLEGKRSRPQWRPVARRVEYHDDDEDTKPKRYDVFINHRGADTKRTVARLLYDQLEHLSGGAIRSFLDNMSMRPGDHLEESIFGAVRECGLAVAIFSKRYCDSDYCLRELAALVEARKTIIPVFYDVQPSDLVLPPELLESGEHPPRDIERFRFALREAKRTAGLGLTYDHATEYVPYYTPAVISAFISCHCRHSRMTGLFSACSDLAELVSAIANAVMERIQEMQSAQQPRQMIVSRL